MPVVCVLIAHFALHVALGDDPARFEQPLLLADGKERARVIDASPRALALGARVGMTVLQAQACVMEATTLITDPAARAARWQSLLDALDAASPLIEDAGEGCAYLDMRGIGGPPEGWLQAIREIVQAAGLPAALGIGERRFIARAAAGHGDERVCPAGAEAAFVAPLPLAVLELPPQICERLELLGVTTLGELAALPHGPFVRRFGAEAARWHALARGLDDAPLRPRPHRTRIARTLYGEGSAASEEQVFFALRTLVAQVADDLRLLGKRAAVLALTLECDDGTTHPLTVRVAHPTARETMLFDLVRARLEGLTLEAPVSGLQLGVDRMESGGVPLPLFAGDDPDPEAVELALARLDAAFGEGAALRARVVEGHRPETQVAYERFTPESLAARTWRLSAPAALAGTTALQYRVIAPRPIDVVLERGAPCFVGTPPLAVRECAGPWRVREGWWSSAPLARDDYDVLLEDGALLRIAREPDGWRLRGLYD